MTPAQRRQATLDLIELQRDLYPNTGRIRLEIDWAPRGVTAARGAPLAGNDNRMEAPTYSDARFDAWAIYDIGTDREAILIVRRG